MVINQIAREHHSAFAFPAVKSSRHHASEQIRHARAAEGRPIQGTKGETSAPSSRSMSAMTVLPARSFCQPHRFMEICNEPRQQRSLCTPGMYLRRT
ncbi:hypothetical protein PY254_16795 [Rhodanobacter sp. AS-Z3]|uniref:hypothetical protein n=1 Tax=Rhodanobacter sp. AS-Z3 TaxID=3031330 RepID=UPI0024788102|nr:hypothetical protein [Rhodanobacter sp. AS-Z3]WEN14867.1 hypothetical protein PY254_16795 [Rhodanobacter sp. AS-Z3]